MTCQCTLSHSHVAFVPFPSLFLTSHHPCLHAQSPLQCSLSFHPPNSPLNTSPPPLPSPPLSPSPISTHLHPTPLLSPPIHITPVFTPSPSYLHSPISCSHSSLFSISVFPLYPPQSWCPCFLPTLSIPSSFPNPLPVINPLNSPHQHCYVNMSSHSCLMFHYPNKYFSLISFIIGC